MSRPCTLCRRHPAVHFAGRGCYCEACHVFFIEDRVHVDLPEGHPFTEARRQRVERMRERVERGLPLFDEEMPPDLR